jgi:AraC-like DNA-binding protein
LSRNLTSKVSIDELAELCYMSKSWFYELFQKEYGVTPMVYRDNLLIEKARALLRNEELSVTEIAEQLGFESVSYFSKFFRKYQGSSPSEYIKNR